MVRFEDNKLVIEIESIAKNHSVENWITLHDALCETLKDTTFMDEDIEAGKGYYYIFDLLKNLVPDWEDAIKMVG